MAKAGRPRKYETERALRKAVKGYFSAISYEREVIVHRREIVEDPKTGEAKVKETPEVLMNADGEPVMETVWIEEPSKSGLFLFLGVSRDTWANYAKDEKLKAVAEEVNARMLARLEEQLNTRNSVQGVIFNLKANYGWTDRVEITHRGGIEEYLEGLESGGAGRGY